METIFGVDVASYQGEPAWDKVHRSGIKFGFSKVTEGTGYVNPTWAHNRAKMRALGDGFLPGAYHFLRGNSDPAAQARHFLDNAGDVSGLAVALDVEAADAKAAHAREWVAEFKRRTDGHPVLGYYPRWYWESTGKPGLTFFDTIWQSHYVEGSGSPEDLYAKVPGSWWTGFGNERISILQFTSSGKVPGISGKVDCNAFRGTFAEFRALTLGEEDDVPIRTSLGKSKPQDLAWDKWTVINWDTEYADPSGTHVSDDDPGYVAPLSTWADLDTVLQVEGLTPGDEYQIRYEVHDWKDGKSAGSWTEIRADHTATQGTQSVTATMSKGLKKGQHVYVCVAVFSAQSGTRPAPRAVTGRYTIRQDRA